MCAIQVQHCCLQRRMCRECCWSNLDEFAERASIQQQGIRLTILPEARSIPSEARISQLQEGLPGISQRLRREVAGLRANSPPLLRRRRWSRHGAGDGAGGGGSGGADGSGHGGGGGGGAVDATAARLRRNDLGQNGYEYVYGCVCMCMCVVLGRDCRSPLPVAISLTGLNNENSTILKMENRDI